MKKLPKELHIGAYETFYEMKLNAFLRATAGKDLNDPTSKPEIIVRLTNKYSQMIATLKVDLDNRTVERYGERPMDFLCDTKIIAWVHACLRAQSAGR